MKQERVLSPPVMHGPTGFHCYKATFGEWSYFIVSVNFLLLITENQTRLLRHPSHHYIKNEQLDNPEGLSACEQFFARAA